MLQAYVVTRFEAVLRLEMVPKPSSLPRWGAAGLRKSRSFAEQLLSDDACLAGRYSEQLSSHLAARRRGRGSYALPTTRL